MNIRKPIVVGQFYPAEKASLQQALDELLSIEPLDETSLPAKIIAGIVPHAGWVCSGAVAGKVFRAIQSRGPVETFVLFGAVHRYGLNRSAIFSSGQWETPLGSIEIDQTLAEQILAETDLVTDNPQAHMGEHSLEVQIPFIQRLFPHARIVPIMIPSNNLAIETGQAIGRILKTSPTPVVCIGSTDLTHYGPAYAMTSHGRGLQGIRWSKEVNDQGLIEKIIGMDARGAMKYAQENQAACGPGALAATIALAEELSARRVEVLEHTNSYEVLHRCYGEIGDDAVGYGAIIFGSD